MDVLDKIKAQREQELKEASMVPKTGIWWIFKGEVISFMDSYTKGETTKGYGGEVYSPRRISHMTMWPYVQDNHPELDFMEYVFIPRGRVNIIKADGKLEAMILCSVQMGAALKSNRNLLEAIRFKHGIKGIPYRIVTDSHYGCSPKVFKREVDKF